MLIHKTLVLAQDSPSFWEVPGLFRLPRGIGCTDKGSSGETQAMPAFHWNFTLKLIFPQDSGGSIGKAARTTYFSALLFLHSQPWETELYLHFNSVLSPGRVLRFRQILLGVVISYFLGYQ